MELKTFEDALRWLNQYGGIRASEEELKKHWPNATCSQLRNAASAAATLHHRPTEEIDRAMLLLIWGGK